MKVPVEKDTEAKPTASTTETTFLKIYAIRKFPLREKTHTHWCDTMVLYWKSFNAICRLKKG